MVYHASFGPSLAHGFGILTLFQQGFGEHHELGDSVARQTFAGLGVTSIKLEDLNVHNTLEHRASTIRNNDTTGNVLTLAPERLAALIRDSKTDSLYVKSMAIPASVSRPYDVIPPAGNCTDLSVIQAPKDRVKAWLIDERLPTEHGWKRSERVVRLVDFRRYVTLS
ncbi:hypothetical protein DL770_010664 [Monosporascus sp. CRB-9-2]|nr:hypothetical protein DL770_010664 [Monosporascus sp. CRB-9-2]